MSQNLAGGGVYGISAFIPVAVNDQLLRLLIKVYLIDPPPFETQNIPLHVDSHCSALYKVSEALYISRLRGIRHAFSLIEAEKSLYRGYKSA